MNDFRWVLFGSAVVLASLALLLRGWGDEQAPPGPAKPRPAKPEPLDEVVGSFRGVDFGDRRREVIRRLGLPPRRPGSWEGVGTPTHSAGPRGRCEPPSLSYKTVDFVLTCARRVWDMAVIAPGARTRRGVSIGDDLDEAEAAYPEITCDTAELGSDAPYEEFPFCSGQIRRNRYIWFGEDPIRSITVSPRDLG